MNGHQPLATGRQSPAPSRSPSASKPPASTGPTADPQTCPCTLSQPSTRTCLGFCSFRHYRQMHAVGEIHDALHNRQRSLGLQQAAQKRLVDFSRIHWKFAQVTQERIRGARRRLDEMQTIRQLSERIILEIHRIHFYLESRLQHND